MAEVHLHPVFSNDPLRILLHGHMAVSKIICRRSSASATMPSPLREGMVAILRLLPWLHITRSGQCCDWRLVAIPCFAPYMGEWFEVEKHDLSDRLGMGVCLACAMRSGRNACLEVLLCAGIQASTMLRLICIHWLWTFVCPAIGHSEVIRDSTAWIDNGGYMAYK